MSDELFCTGYITFSEERGNITSRFLAKPRGFCARIYGDLNLNYICRLTGYIVSKNMDFTTQKRAVSVNFRLNVQYSIIQ